ncbi:NAD(+) diphosphatase [Vibrio sp. Of7-15]|uniref:NAD(+) diphosphatase n=1 Tax=Vibrio sp. Of7-15 TaxID=2724879 RepID=UPI001EF33E07|nr:NAD(+) diphosphatase [Vibrio sp. Of7-15]MCG7498951.1 NAD(+) diphosphatase [Vibrio sp. Of7-15]
MLKNNEIVYWCVVDGSALWLEEGLLPLGSAEEFSFPVEQAVIIGKYKDHAVAWLNDDAIENTIAYSSLRELLTAERALFDLASKAVQFGIMSQTFRFCPQCGGRNNLNHNQLAMQCHECRTLHYPRISPCIIVAVRKGDQILLAQHPRHRNGLYTVIAGFVEVGETLEQCVHREVKEETGIDISNVRYFGSQPWAFPSNLMAGFIAEYAGGELKPDYSELSDAQWFSKDELPLLAPEGTIARELIKSTLGLETDR